MKKNPQIRVRNVAYSCFFSSFSFSFSFFLFLPFSPPSCILSLAFSPCGGGQSKQLGLPQTRRTSKMGLDDDDTRTASLASTQIGVLVLRQKCTVVAVSSSEEQQSQASFDGKLGAKPLISTCSSRWYPPFFMKVPGLLIHIFVQKQKLCKWIRAKLSLILS